MGWEKAVSKARETVKDVNEIDDAISHFII
jgi:hypothetical protein